MGNSFARKVLVHPLESSRIEAPPSSRSTGTCRIKVRIPAREFEDLLSRAANGDSGIGELILQGCLKERWEAVSVSQSERGNENQKVGRRTLETIDEECKLKQL